MPDALANAGLSEIARLALPDLDRSSQNAVANRNTIATTAPIAAFGCDDHGADLDAGLAAVGVRLPVAPPKKNRKTYRRRMPKPMLTTSIAIRPVPRLRSLRHNSRSWMPPSTPQTSTDSAAAKMNSRCRMALKSGHKGRRA